MAVKKQAKGPKFRAGQVVRHHIAGGFYSRIVRIADIAGGYQTWHVMEQGKITKYFEWQLRSLTVREAGPARGRKRNG